jgi:hypothetical protein
MKRFDNQVCLKLAGPLRAHLEDEARERSRSLSNLIRQILINHTTERVAASATNQQKAA